MCCFPEILQNFSERQILWSLCSVDFHALTLKLPIRTLFSVARKLPVFTLSGEKCENLSKTSTPWNRNKNCCQSVDLPSFITARKRCLGQGNIFRSVFQEFYLSTGESASVHAGIPPPRTGRDPPGPGTHLLGPGTPPGTRYPLGAEHAGRYGQRASGTHPTGMHSCFSWNWRMFLRGAQCELLNSNHP